MLRRVSALYNNSKVLSFTFIHLSASLYQFHPKHVLYFLYAALLVQFLGEVLIVIFTYFNLNYVHEGMAFVFAPIRAVDRNLFVVLGQPVPGVPFYVCLTTTSAPYFWM